MKKMAKIFGAMIVAVIALVVVSSVAMAAGPRNGDGDGVRDLLNEGGTTLYGGRAYGFVDEDGDGINDRYTDGSPLFIDEDGDGVCDLLNQDGEMAAYSYGYARMARTPARWAPAGAATASATAAAWDRPEPNNQLSAATPATAPFSN